MSEQLTILNIWAVVFISCVVGIIELLQELSNWHDYDGREGRRYTLYKPAVFVLYFLLVSGVILCMDRFVRYYIEIRKANTAGGSPFFDFLLWFDEAPYIYIPIIVGAIITILVFGLIFLCKTGWDPIQYLKHDAPPSTEFERKDEESRLTKDEETCRSSLEIEYKELAEAIRHRGHQYVTVQSILISGSLVAVAAILRDQSLLGEYSFVFIGVLGAALSMSVIAFWMHFTTEKIDGIYWDRVHALERGLGIEKGHGKIYESIENEWWFKLRRCLWRSIFAVLTVFYVVVCYALLI